MAKPRTQARQRLEDNAAELVAAYREGAAIRELAETYQASYQNVREVLWRNGAELRTRGVRYQTTGRYKPKVRQRLMPAVPPPVDGDVVSLQEVRESAGLTQAEMGSVVDLTGPRIAQLEGQPVVNLRVGRLAELVEGCAAQLQVLVVFDDVTVALYDSAVDVDG